MADEPATALHRDPHAVPQSRAIAAASRPGDKMAAVVMAVDAQLITDHRPLPHDPDGTMGDTYHYQEATMRGFLAAVAARLILASFAFDPRSVDANAALAESLSDLVDEIYNATR